MVRRIAQIIFLMMIFGGAGILLVDLLTDVHPLWGLLGGWVTMVCVLVAASYDNQSEEGGMY
ncbi:hypothetical protein VPHK397_0132 [Vibrio phage K397]